MSSALSARNAVVRIDGEILEMMSWDVDPHAAPVDDQSFEDEGYESWFVSARGCTVTISGFYTTYESTFVDHGIHPGALLENVRLYLDGITSAYWHFPFLQVEGHPQRASAKGGHEIKITCRSNGKFYLPDAPGVVQTFWDS